MKVVVVGLGYVGAVTAACLAELGHDVVGVDVDDQKTRLMLAGKSPIIEPGLDDLVARGRDGGLLDVSADLTTALDGASVVLVCVGTPARSDGSIDLTYVERVTEELADLVWGRQDFLAVVYRSTVPPGTVDGHLRQMLEEQSGRTCDADFGIAMTPEFLREGSGIDDFFNPPFTVLGIRDERTESLLRELFCGVERPLHPVGIEAAEALKYACNAFHAVKVTFANEIGRILGAIGVDSRDVMRVFREDTRLNASPAYLRPGFAFGGSCLPKDMRGLMQVARAANVDVPMLGGVMRSNELHVGLAARTVLDLGYRRVALLGLSFKPETDDLRESPYVELAEILVGKGADLGIYDPIVHPEKLIGANRRYVDERLPHLREMLAASPDAALDGREIAVAATSDPAALKALVRAAPPHVVDLHGRLGPAVEALPGYRGIAW